MRRMGGHVVCLGVGLSLLTSLDGPCFAQDYPTRPIHLIVPFAAGGGAHAVARVVASAGHLDSRSSWKTAVALRR